MSFELSGQELFVKKWDKRFGGNEREGFLSLIKTAEKGFLLGGTSKSGVSGDKTEASRGDDDYWIVKIDSNGNKQWDKRFGGAGGEGLSVVRQTGDKGYILGGISYSNVGGDKTQFHWGGGDYWLVKIDSAGNKIWDKRFGGTSSDFLYALALTRDGGYIAGGLSSSRIGGDKTQDNWDTTTFYDDGWVVKVDSLGNMQWDKRLGGYGQDDVAAITESSDGGYIIGCYSASGVGGDRTQPPWGSGGSDYWIVKLDSLGNKLWDRRFGGTNGEYLHAIANTNDGGFLIGGHSYSDSSGDITNPGPQWLVKIDENGNKIWDKGFFGGLHEFNNLSQTSDGGFLFTCRICGQSGSDKSEQNLGSCQAWVVKIDSAGNKQWDKTIFTTGFDGYSEAVETHDGCYVVAVGTSAGIGGYITEPNRDGIDSTGDYWIMKFCWEPVGINDVSKQSNVLVYPNPFSTDISITLQNPNASKASFTLSNIQGQVLFRREETNLANPYTKMLDLSYLPNGVYLIEVIANGERVVKKVVKE